MSRKMRDLERKCESLMDCYKKMFYIKRRRWKWRVKKSRIGAGRKKGKRGVRSTSVR